MRNVVTTVHFALDVDDDARVARITRTSTPLDAATVDAAFAPVTDALAKIDHASWSLLLDLRAAPLRHDPELETALSPRVTGLSRNFRRQALLVRTAVGVLQVNRVSREAVGAAPSVFRDEGEALAWLSAG